MGSIGAGEHGGLGGGGETFCAGELDAAGLGGADAVDELENKGAAGRVFHAGGGEGRGGGGIEKTAGDVVDEGAVEGEVRSMPCWVSAQPPRFNQWWLAGAVPTPMRRPSWRPRLQRVMRMR